MKQNVIDVLIERAMSKSPWLKKCSIEALSLLVLVDTRIENILINAISDKDPDVRYYAINGLRKLGKVRHVKILFLALEKERVDELIDKLKDTIYEIINAEAIEDIIPFLRSRRSIVRAFAAELLGELKANIATDELIRLLKDRNRDVRKVASEAIGKINDAIAGKKILELLKGCERDSHLEAYIWALGELKYKDALDALFELTAHENSDIRTSVAWALGKIRDKRATQYLVKMLKDSDVNVRYEAVIGLGKLNAKESVPELISALNDPDDDIREIIVETLGKLRDHRAFKALVNELSDINPNVKIAAIEALKKLGDIKALNYILETVYDEDEFVREAARGAILELLKREKNMASFYERY
ncbi:MAG: HEAT repeat domain-containing protein [Candidatus Odinarchaeota archaeon]|nr:HEAT repeat domain-containing protein [Candidatus Odinarchaeota archaeon]